MTESVPRGPRGGVLLDFFLIVVLCAGGAALWMTRARWWEQVSALGGRFRSSPPPSKDERVKDLSARSAAAQSRIRAFLVDAGVSDKDVLKTFNVQREEGGARWVEGTVEVRAGKGFHSGRFLKALLPSLQQEHLRVVTDEATEKRWLLELGEGERVFQRLVFHTPA